MTSMPQNWASQPHIPLEDYQRQGNQKRGRRGEQVIDQGRHKESIILSNKKGDSRFQLPDNTRVLKHTTGKDLSNTPFHTIISLTQNLHIHQLQIHLHVSLTLNSLLWLPFEEESPVGRTLNAQSVTPQGITPVWVPPWSSGPIAPSCSSRITNIIRTCYRHFYPVRQRTQLTSRYLT